MSIDKLLLPKISVVEIFLTFPNYKLIRDLRKNQKDRERSSWKCALCIIFHRILEPNSKIPIWYIEHLNVEFATW